MRQFGKLIKTLSLLAGAGIVLLGVIWLVVAASGAVKTGQAFAFIVGAAFLVVAIPFLVFPFSSRLAKVLAVLVLLMLALAMLWFAFRPGTPIDRPVLAQVGAIAFAVLLFARVGLALHRKRSGLGT
ncbi:hypothetical protein [Lysobacter sp. Root494]|uniref:hypothetical protein n=1 Tax=Lysobacter sp. Root494 TaxID=1736549 RepID=UPI0006F75BB5|nr:hypothetical protein [Lysobacter sp. Root494]KQY48647.1 hypothetical protein ASD14_15530 [Lysobacter sp. Root494]